MNYKTFWDKSKPAFLILHWWWWSSNSWVEIGKRLWKDFFVIIPDIPCASKEMTEDFTRRLPEGGKGLQKISSEDYQKINRQFSENLQLDHLLSPCDKVYTLDDYADLIKNFIEELWLKDFILLGHSNGWAIAAKLVTKYPDLPVRKLILNNSAWIRKDKKRDLKRKVFWVIAKFVKPIFSLFWMWKMRNLFYRAIWGHDYLEAEKNPNKKQTYLNMINSDLQDVFPKIKKNTLLIRGENDTYTPLSDGKKIQNLIKNSKLVVIKDVRHGIHLQKPEELVKVILENIVVKSKSK